MRKLLLVFLLYIMSSQASAQDNRFIYIQSEAHKPFYVRINSRQFKASADGHLLIQGLQAANYQIFIGTDTQPGSEWKFNLNLGNEDLAFTLKTRGSGLELETLGDARVITGDKQAIQSGGGTSYRTPVITGPASDDAFSMMLAGVVNDPTIREASALIQKQDLIAVKETTATAKTTQEPFSSAPVASALATPAPAHAVDSARASTSSLTDDLIAGLGKKTENNNSVAESPKTTTSLTESAPAATVASTPASSTVPVAPTESDMKAISSVPDDLMAGPGKKTENSTSVTENPNSKKTATETAPSASVASGPASSKTPASTDIIKKATSSLSDDLIAGLGKKTESNTGTASNVKNDSVTNDSAPLRPVASAPAPNKSAPATDSVKKATASLSDDLIAGLSKKEEPGSKDNNQPKATAPTVAASETTQMPKENKADYETPFVIKEVKITDQKATAATHTEPKAEQQPGDNKPAQGNQPFVIKEKLIIDSHKPGNGVSTSIKKTLQRRSSDGIELIYIDEQTNGVKDIIRILIPAN